MADPDPPPAPTPDPTEGYTFRVQWSADDQEFVGTCLEFPSLSWLSETPTKAMIGIRKLVAVALADLDDDEKPTATQEGR